MKYRINCDKISQINVKIISMYTLRCIFLSFTIFEALLIKKFPFMEPKGSIQKPAVGPCPERVESSSHTTYLITILNLYRNYAQISQVVLYVRVPV